MSGFDTNGKIWVGDYLMRTAGLQSAYPSLNEAPDSQELLKQWYGNRLDLVQKQLAIGKPREGLKTSWFAEWDKFNQVQVQNAVLGKVTPTEALTQSANKARELKKAKSA
jgi:hypothetical protein